MLFNTIKRLFLRNTRKASLKHSGKVKLNHTVMLEARHDHVIVFMNMSLQLYLGMILWATLLSNFSYLVSFVYNFFAF